MSSPATAGSPRSTSAPPHLLVFPFPAQGHIIPLLDFLHHLSLRCRSLTITVILTPQNAHLLSPYSSSSIQTLILPLSSHPSIPYGAENVKDLPNASYGIALAHALLPLHVPIVNWARSQSTTPPTALLSDFFLGWTQSLIASELNIPYLVFYSSGALLASVLHYLWNSDNDSRRDGVVVPDFLSFPEPHYPSVYRRYRKGVPEWECMRDGMLSNSAFNWGLVLNTFEDIESVYLEHLKKEFGHQRVWAVGPILPFGPIEKRGGSSESEEVLQSWLDSCPEENSVVYISFGSQYRIPMAMAAAIAMGLEKSGVKFIWCVKEVGGGKGSSVVPEGFEERMKGRGVIVRGWAPQVVILRHKAAAFTREFATDTAPLKKTALYDFHVSNGGKMVPFAGWSMPIQYKDSIMDSTLNCRSNGSIFDVSHMCGLSLKGKDCIPFLETLVVADVAGLKDGTGTLTVFTNENGGAIDDSVIARVTDKHLYIVVNAGCREKDLEHIGKHMEIFKKKGGDVDWHVHDERSLLALQGPLAAPVLQHLTKDDLSKMYFGEFRTLDINGVHCFLTRTGYTGEDGFEISVPSENAVDLAKALLEKSEGKVRLTGLGARDSLRLEAGLCLYGNDMEQHVTPVEAGLNWAIGKRRRAEGGFLGADVILKQLAEGPAVRRVGFFSSGPPPRSHSEVLSSGGEKIGEVTSGGFSPCLKKNIAMGYVKSGNHKAGTEVKLVVRGKAYDGVITKMPFVPTKYYKSA